VVTFQTRQDSTDCQSIS
jgi:hypothetical protein